MVKWEYCTEEFETTGFSGGILDLQIFNDRLNDLGSRGWELVNAFATHRSQGETRFVMAVFKRMLS